MVPQLSVIYLILLWKMQAATFFHSNFLWIYGKVEVEAVINGTVYFGS